MTKRNEYIRNVKIAIYAENSLRPLFVKWPTIVICLVITDKHYVTIAI